MKYLIRTLIAATSLALLASCASTGESTDEDQTQQDATAQQGITAQPGEDAYSYAYGQAPGGYDASDASSGRTSGRSSRPGQAVAGAGNVVSADRIVYFDFDSAEIRPESRTIIESNARNLAGNRRTVTQLEGHTDERGSREYNIALGERRANAVRQVMIAMGVSPQQIRVVSYGEERPAAGGQDEQSYALNRRVEIVY
jgi:peptidoglycan-associated lipoprotein